MEKLPGLWRLAKKREAMVRRFSALAREALTPTGQIRVKQSICSEI